MQIVRAHLDQILIGSGFTWPGCVFGANPVKRKLELLCFTVYQCPRRRIRGKETREGRIRYDKMLYRDRTDSPVQEFKMSFNSLQKFSHQTLGIPEVHIHKMNQNSCSTNNHSSYLRRTWVDFSSSSPVSCQSVHQRAAYECLDFTLHTGMRVLYLQRGGGDDGPGSGSYLKPLVIVFKKHLS